jgi:hypothetical protein
MYRRHQDYFHGEGGQSENVYRLFLSFLSLDTKAQMEFKILTFSFLVLSYSVLTFFSI